MKRILIIATLCIAAHADSVPFVIQSNGTQAVSLVGNPTVGPSYTISQSLGGAYLQFSMVSLPTGSGTLSLTMDGVTRTVGLISDGSSIVQGFNVPRDDYHAVPFTLTVTMNGESSVFSGYFVDPVPEPGTWLLMGTGLVALWRRYR